MRKSSAALSPQQRLREALDAIPPGRVAGVSDLARHLGCMTPLVSRLLAELRDKEPSAPWHRAVADGGAIGRHAWRSEQMALLRAEGVPVSPAGIVQDFANRRVADFEAQSGTRQPAVAMPGAGDATPSRARGRMSQPISTVGRK